MRALRVPLVQYCCCYSNDGCPYSKMVVLTVMVGFRTLSIIRSVLTGVRTVTMVFLTVLVVFRSAVK